MSFDYHKTKNHEDHGSFWTSYSDLFLGMSVVFLLLYVTASMRSGTNGIQMQIENKKLERQVQDLQNQLKMYDSVKNEYLGSQATQGEQQQYNELMDKLTLLQEEARSEKKNLEEAANENAKKERALNQYQQMVRNIVNANLMAKTKIKTREELIGEQKETIGTQGEEIRTLERDVKAKEREISSNEKKIEDARQELARNLNELKYAYKQKKMTEAKYQKQVAKLKQQSQDEVKALESMNSQTRSQLNQVQGKLAQVAGQLSETESALSAQKAKSSALSQQLGQQAEAHSKKIEDLKKGFADQAAKDRAAFDSQLAKERLSAGEKLARERAFRDQQAAKEKQLGDQIAQLGGRLKDTEGQLARAKAEADARKQIIRDIREGFRKAGVNANIDDQTGEVEINFGDVYFDNDSAKLKERMKEILKKAMPVYSKSLLGDQKIAKKIASVEIVGFASPTYKGKFVDPSKIDGENKNAVNHNLDLSYNRARSIFQYVFDESNLQFSHQKDLIPLIKVSGRSFFAERLPASATKGKSDGDFCTTHDCKRAQKVIIKFNFEDRK